MVYQVSDLMANQWFYWMYAFGQSTFPSMVGNGLIMLHNQALTMVYQVSDLMANQWFYWMYALDQSTLPP